MDNRCTWMSFENVFRAREALEAQGFRETSRDRFAKRGDVHGTPVIARLRTDPTGRAQVGI